tara:strand:- start:4380 stop:5420 length:1041 start_codon:yes stop_codon:yes gene_type:complete
MQQVIDLFSEYTKEVDVYMNDVLTKHADISLYKHLSYFLGFLDEELQPVQAYAGKRMRAGLCMLLADWYGSKKEALSVAASIELFHNFTLIHDDIVDEDAVRRGRPTVWKLFGVDHAINSGDAQLLIALQVVTNATDLSDQQKVALNSFLTKQYLRVVEGQYLDFSLTKKTLEDGVSEEEYYKMIGRKTADLIAASTQAAGVVAQKRDAELEALFAYGHSVGMAYQLCDDLVSIWGSQEQTGKRAYGDLLEKKKTLPVIHLYEKASQDVQERLRAIYAPDTVVSQEHAQEIVKILEVARVRIYVEEKVVEYVRKAKDSTHVLSITPEQKEQLCRLVDDVLPITINI